MDYERAYKEMGEKFNTIIYLPTVKDTGTIFVDDVRKIIPELAESEVGVLEEEIEKWLGCKAFPEGTNITPLPKAMEIVRETANHFYDFGRKQQAIRNIQCTNSQVITPESYINEGQKKGIQIVLDNPQEYGLQKPAEWSEEDRRKLNRIYSILWQAADTHAFSTTCRLIGDKECIELQDFLKVLKERVQPQPKQEWSEEDSEHINSLIERLDGMCKEGATFIRTRFAVSEDIDWLKSLRPQNTWKPSVEQMRVLDLAIRCGINRGTTEEATLVSLFNDLKKLK